MEWNAILLGWIPLFVVGNRYDYYYVSKRWCVNKKVFGKKITETARSSMTKKDG